MGVALTFIIFDSFIYRSRFKLTDILNVIEWGVISLYFKEIINYSCVTQNTKSIDTN